MKYHLLLTSFIIFILFGCKENTSKNEKSEILESIQSSGKLEENIEKELVKIIEDFKKDKK